MPFAALGGGTLLYHTFIRARLSLTRRAVAQPTVGGCSLERRWPGREAGTGGKAIGSGVDPPRLRGGDVDEDGLPIAGSLVRPVSAAVEVVGWGRALRIEG